MRLNQILPFATVLLTALLLVACGNNGNKSGETDNEENNGATQENEATDREFTRGAAEFSFEKTSHDFGRVPRGERVTQRFTFVNTGNEPLVIQDASAGCGCTIPEYSKEPVPPGESGFVDVEYNSEGRTVQQFNQNVTLRANTERGIETLRISGEVVEGDGSSAKTRGETDAYGRLSDDPHYGHDHPSPGHDQQVVEQEKAGPEMIFDNPQHDFGTIEDGEIVSTHFHFTNTGNEPLVINEVKARCGCTSPKYTDGPVAPGERGFIEVEYDSSVRPVNEFHQTVTVEANTSLGSHRLNITGIVNR